MNAADESPEVVVRRAAELMRERAAAATPGPWLGVNGKFNDGEWPCVITAQGDPKDSQTWLLGAGNGGVNREADVTYVGSMHPLVALAVADLLEEVARQYDAPPCDSPGGACSRCDRRDDFNDALRLAWAYLGKESGS